MMKILRDIRLCWRLIIFILVPLVFSPILNGETKAAKCGYTVLIMAVFWMTEVVPLPVTALIPVILFPLLGVMDTDAVCMAYIKQTNMTFLSGLVVAISVEHCNLHRRIALRVLLLVGTSARWLMLGFMLSTMFLSMWISNTATTAMMVPILEAVLEELKEKRERTNISSNISPFIVKGYVHSPSSQNVGNVSSSGTDVAEDSYEMKINTEATENLMLENRDEKSFSEEAVQKTIKQHRVGLFLSVAYAANIGGTGTQTGTGPNLILKGILPDQFGGNTGLSYITWIAFAVPGMFVNVILSWLLLQFLFIGFYCKDTESDKEKTKDIRQLIEKKYRDLGKITYHEKSVLFLFIVLVFLWLFIDPQFVTGWAEYIPGAKVGDATAATAIVLLLFIFPSKFGFSFYNINEERFEAVHPLIDWKTVEEKLPWGLIILLGGGFALADVAKDSGLSDWVGEQLAVLGTLPAPAISLILTVGTALVTEIVSNSATASVFLPVVAQLAVNVKVNPLYLMLPTTISCSYAFMLPVATAPNAIVFTAARMDTKDMIKAGSLMNLISIAVVMTMMNTYGVALFDLHTFPEWAVKKNTSITQI